LPTILHTADVHLGRNWTELGDASARLRDLHWECFESLCRIAVDRGAVALVIAGDLFERPDPPGELVTRVGAAFERLAGHGVSVVIVPGTHDSAHAPGSVYGRSEFRGARVFRQPELTESFSVRRGDSELVLAGLAWDPQRTPADYLKGYRPGDEDLPRVIVLHADVGARASGRPKDLPAEAERLSATGADYVALGHRHAYREFRSADRIWGGYPGTPFGLSFAAPELGPRTASLVSVERGRGARIERVSTTPVQWLRAEIDMGAIRSEDDLVCAIRERAGRQNLLRLRLNGAAGFGLDLELLGARLGADFLHLEMEDESLEIAVELLQSLADEQSVRGIFARRMVERLARAGTEAERLELSAAAREGMAALAEEG
jgi:DNA repair exonuclease SbcCD nuclease subunit